MNLSIFSFKNKYRSLLVVVIILGICEMTLRKYENFLSKDIVSIKNMRNIHSDICEFDGKAILFIGNSLTRQAIDENVVKQNVENSCTEPVYVGKMIEDGTVITDWIYIYKHYFYNTAKRPELVIINFRRDELKDQPANQIENYAAYYCNLAEIPSFVFNKNYKLNEKVNFMLSYFLRLFTNRNRLRLRLFDAFVPYYEETTKFLNNNLNATFVDRVDRFGSYFTLESFIYEAKKNNTHMMFFAIPTKKNRKYDPHLKYIIEANGMKFIDERRNLNMVDEMFLDNAHMNNNGAEYYSNYVSDKIISFLQ